MPAADLSRLTDEQLQVYKDLLLKKSQDSAPAQNQVREPAGTGRRFLDTITTNSPLNPMNWPGMVSSAFESPFSDSSLQEAQRQADVISGKAKPEPFNQGDIGEGAGHLVNMGLMGLAGKGASMLPGSKAGAIMSGAGKGAWQGATEMVPSTHWPMSQLPPLPAPLVGGATGAGIGKYLGGQPGEIAGGVIGGAAPIVRGAWQGGKQALKRFGTVPEPPVGTSPTPSPSSALPLKLPLYASPAEQAMPEGAGGVGGVVIETGKIPVRAHETNTKVDQQINNKVSNLADYLRSKGGTPEHLDQIVNDPGLTRQYLNEAHSYGKAQGNPVPKTGYKGLDPGSDTHQAVRQRLLDMIEEEKNTP